MALPQTFENLLGKNKAHTVPILALLF